METSRRVDDREHCLEVQKHRLESASVKLGPILLERPYEGYPDRPELEGAQIVLGEE